MEHQSEDSFAARMKFFRGKTIEELQKLDIREFSKFLKSRSRRAIMRNSNVIESFIKRCEKKILKNKSIRTHKRDIVIVPAMVGMTISVHAGKKEFVPVKIVQEMLGHRLGEFAHTRKKVGHGSPGVGSTKSSASKSVK